MTTYDRSTTRTTASTGALRGFAALTGITSLAIFLQAVTAGQFLQQEGNEAWVEAHGVIADVAWGFALVTAIFALVTLRKAQPRLTVLTVVLFVLTLGQTGMGHLITDLGQDAWIPVHVPVAFVVFGLTAWLSFKAAQLRRASR
ncbi:hypothetical protein AS850_06285 [Frondihabitans sp. 762G35]|uniref:hypothetical protein n=1 Tax=Frondihabitans sp. 762G35 TaxID=1446794 RepID=UPI000D22090C|nr:hypothetical protein [Frondihabitans sp. 762G35]ARC56681.1 hypothetical protein AS850_06285 [Frondihabitans sp. 762G35]